MLSSYLVKFGYHQLDYVNLNLRLFSNLLHCHLILICKTLSLTRQNSRYRDELKHGLIEVYLGHWKARCCCRSLSVAQNTALRIHQLAAEILNVTCDVCRQFET